jgi:hypothetical protein
LGRTSAWYNLGPVRRLVSILTIAVLTLGTLGAGAPSAGRSRPRARNVVHLVNRPWAPVNSDLAFWENLVFAGNYRGFRIYDISDPADPGLLSTFYCRGPQSDVTVHQAGQRLILVQSVDDPQTTGGCPSKDRPLESAGFEGLRVFDVTDPRAPFFVKAVPTDCGSHTHTWVPDRNDQRSLIYVSSFPSAPNPNCHRPHAKISIVEIPDRAPEQARVLSERPLHDDTKNELGVGCHDIAVFVDLDVAAAACSSEGQLWDISDPANPDTTGPGHTHVRNRKVGYWHSAQFTWDGKVVLFGDETYDGCRGPRDRQGNIWFYATVTPGLPIGVPGGRYTIPRRQPEPFLLECTIHNYNVILVEGRYLGVAGVYTGGTSVFDFTDPAHAREVAFFDAGGRRYSNVWSSYWYNDHIYAGDIRRGLDVLQLLDEQGQPVRARTFPYMNPQTQESLTAPGG